MSWYPQHGYPDPNYPPSQARRPYAIPPPASRVWIAPSLVNPNNSNSVIPPLPIVPPAPYYAPVRAVARNGTFKNRSLIVNHSNAVASGSSTPMLTDEDDDDRVEILTESKPIHVQPNLFRGKQGTLVSGDKLKQQLVARKAKLDLEKAEKEKLEVLRVARGSARGRGVARGRGRGGRPVAVVRTVPQAASTELCRFFTKTGECSKALTCRYVHDDAKMALCPLFLSKRCPHSATTCRLSHSPSPSNAPQCKHYPLCRASSCPYAHQKVDRDTALCKEFAEKGWCDKGESCEERHVVGCWEFSKLGTCTTKGCKGPHILMRKEAKEKVDEGAGVRWMEDFMGDLTPQLVEERKRKAETEGGRDGFVEQDKFQSFEVEDSEEEEEEEEEEEIMEIALSKEENSTAPEMIKFDDDEELDYGEDESRIESEEEEDEDEVISTLLVQ